MRHLLALGLVATLLAGCSPTDAVTERAADGADPAPNDQESADPEPEDIAERAGEDRPAQQPTEESEAHEDAEDADDGDPTAVTIVDFAFDSDDVRVAVGDTVTWTHEGDITHNVTARDGTFVSDSLTGGDTFSHTFDAAGTYDYVCTLHGQMEASVQVG